MTHVNGTNNLFNILKVELARVFLAENVCSAGSVKASHHSKMKAPVDINADRTFLFLKA